jgi:hypothetical protein
MDYIEVKIHSSNRTVILNVSHIESVLDERGTQIGPNPYNSVIRMRSGEKFYTELDINQIKTRIENA